MINHLDCQIEDRPAIHVISCNGSFGSVAGAAWRSLPENGAGEGATEGRRHLSGNAEFRRLMTEACPCGKQHFWGGPVCADCFAAGPEHIQQAWLIGAPARRQLAIQWLTKLALIRGAAGPGLHTARTPVTATA